MCVRERERERFQMAAEKPLEMPSCVLVQPFPCRIFLDPIIAGSENMHFFFFFLLQETWPNGPLKHPCRFILLALGVIYRSLTHTPCFRG